MKDSTGMLAWFGCCGGVLLVPLLIWIFFRSAITAGVKVAGKGKPAAAPPAAPVQAPFALTEDRVRQIVREEIRAIQAARAARGSTGASPGSPG